MERKSFLLLLSGICCAAFLNACASSDEAFVAEEPLAASVCTDDLVETTNTGLGEPVICCPVGTIGQDGFCVDSPKEFNNQEQAFPEPTDVVTQGVSPELIPAPQMPEPPLVVDEEQPVPQPVEAPATVPAKADMPEPQTFVYLTAPAQKGSAYCPARANSLAWNGVQFKCCGYQKNATVVPSRSDSVCCPVGSTEARWIGKEGFDYECCAEG